jgi:hypothetical protein
MRSFFQNKTCDICKKPATKFRLIKYKHFMLCDDKECDLYTRIKTGWFELINIGKNNDSNKGTIK